LTATQYQRQLDQTSHRQLPVRHSQAVRQYMTVRNPQTKRACLLAVAVLACQLAGIAAVVHSYTIAQTTLSNESEFVWFWVGMLLIELPLSGLITRSSTPRTMRTALLLLYGFVSYAPKLLRNPASPVYHDEFAHWRETYEILSTGKLFQPTPLIHIIAQFPGLHAATAALVHATGLTIWQAATMLLIFFHVSLVLGIAALAQALGFNNRTASFIAILYALNSSFLYFDTQFGYESMAITLVVWTLTAYVRAIRSQPREGRAAWGTLTIMFSAGTVITHHLSTFTLVLIMALVSVAVSVPWLARGEGWIRTAATAWSLTLTTLLMAGAWFHFVAPDTWSYLSPYVGQGFSELMQDVNGSGSTKQLFAASLSPWWEQWCGYLVTFIALGVAIGGLLLIRARIRDGRLPRGNRRAILFAFVLSGLAYFPSTLFILSVAGSEGARRSWAFTWIGLSILTGPAAVWLIDWTGRCTYQLTRISARLGLVAVFAIALIGGTAAGVNAAYRFPGPFLYGSDARSITPELLAASEWFSARFGTGNNVITDRYTGLVFASFGLQNTDSPSSGFPVYNLYLAKPGAPIEPAYLLPDLGLANYAYLIIDERIAYDLPEIGVYFTPSDPASVRPQNGKSPFYGMLNKFDRIQWAIKIFQSDNYSIYRLNLPVTHSSYQLHPPMSRGKRGQRGNVLQGKLSVTP
jgi:hypothetical protein